MTKIVCISDTHCQLSKVAIPDGDILVHSGDLTYRGTVKETSKELFELSKHRARFKAIVLTEGNHDWLGARDPHTMDQMCKDNGVILLRDSGVEIEGIRFYGSPWQPEFCNWSFNLPRGQALKEKWALIPEDTQVLLTHSPPMSILDCVEKFDKKTGTMGVDHVGCVDLYNRVTALKQLKLHIFGHLHYSYGQIQKGSVTYVNASVCTEQYAPLNKPIIFEI